MSVTLPAAANIPSRTTGVAPLAVFFDATALTSTNTSNPFHDCLVRWDFGDVSAGTWAISGKSKNEAYGPIAAHVYETGGTFTWNCWSLDSDFGISNVSGQITVTAGDSEWSGTKTICVSNNTDFTGAPTGSSNRPNVTTASALMTIITEASNRRILLHRGHSWSGSFSTKNLSVSGPSMVGAFGSGAKPVITQTGSGGVFMFSAGNEDWRLVDLQLVGPGEATTEEYAIMGGDSSTSAQNRSLCMRLDCSDFNGLYITDGYLQYVHHGENFLIDCTSTDMGGDTWGSNHIYSQLYKSAIMGCTAEGALGKLEHICRVAQFNRLIISHNSFKNPEYVNGKHSLKYHCFAGSFGSVAQQYGIVSHNTLKGSGTALDLAPQNTEEDENIHDVIIESNRVEEDTRVTFQYQILVSAVKVTVRNNYGENGSSTGGTFIRTYDRGQADGTNNIWIYNNTAYKGESGDYNFCVEVGAGSYITAKNNLLISIGTMGSHGAFNNEGGGAGIVESNNVERTNTTGLVDPPSLDFHLTVGSPMIAAGATVPTFTDYDFLKRPQNTTWDVGAFEYDYEEDWDFGEESYGLLW